jgi:trans-aconitate methyltransferase
MSRRRFTAPAGIGAAPVAQRPLYSVLAPGYDAALGMDYFRGARAAFEEVVKRYGINFHSAADLDCGTGLFARYLSQRWDIPTFAVDRSPAMLAIAMRNCTSCEVRLLERAMAQVTVQPPRMSANAD